MDSAGIFLPADVKEIFTNIKSKFKVKIEIVEIIKENIVFKVPGKLN